MFVEVKIFLILLRCKSLDFRTNEPPARGGGFELQKFAAHEMLKLEENHNGRRPKSRFDGHVDLDWSLASGGILPAPGGLFVSFQAAMRSRKGAALDRDTSVWILFGIGLLLIVFHAIAAALIAVFGMAYFGLLKAALLLTAAFAVVGMVFGLVRGLRSATAIKTRNA